MKTFRSQLFLNPENEAKTSFSSKLSVSRMKMHSHSFNTSMLIMLIALACEYFDMRALMVPVALVITITSRFSETEFLIPTSMIGIGLCLHNPTWFLPFYLTVIGIDQESFVDQFKIAGNWIRWALLKVSGVSILLTRPTFGTNSTYWASLYNTLEHLFENLSEIRHESLSFSNRMIDLTTSKAKYIRPNGITDTPMPLLDYEELMEPSKVVQAYHTAAKQYRGLAVFFIIVGTIVLTGMSAGVAVVSVVLIWMLQKPMSTMTQVKISNRGPPIKDGIYRITTNAFVPILSTDGIGVAYNKVLHVPYHVCNGNPIQLGSATLYPYHVSIDKDLVTYGNGPQLMPPKEEYEVYINTETEEARSTYSIGKQYKYANGVLVIPSVTEPGHSGSPIYGRDTETGNLYLLGLAGRFIGTFGSSASEFHESPVPIYQKENVEYVVEHPGYGKTRKIVPDKIRESLLANPLRKVLVTGPTKVVCRELYLSLQNMRGITTSLNISGSEHRKSRANVEIAAHRTALKMLTSEDINLKQYSTIIIDEAHQDDAATVLLRRYVRKIPDMRIIEMSATLNGIYNNNSNFHIEDRKIIKSDINHLVSQLMAEGKRVLLYVSGIKTRDCTEYLKAYKEYKPIILSRMTLDKERPSLDDLERRLIISTDISEIGINIPDLDCVIDPREKFTYMENSGMVMPVNKNISKASAIQRRGRVGRSKAGTYYYVDLPFDEEDTVAQFDADILSYGRSWGNTDKALPFALSDKQYLKWLDSDLTPFMVYFTFDQLGNIRDEHSRKELWSLLTGKGTPYPGCRNQNCPCAGRYEFLDLRNHLELFGYYYR